MVATSTPPEMVEPHWNEEDYWRPFAAVVPGEAVIAFTPEGGHPLKFQGLEAKSYRAFLFNPGDGSEQSLGNITPDAAGAWQSPEFPIFRDWVLVLDGKG